MPTVGIDSTAWAAISAVAAAVGAGGAWQAARSAVKATKNAERLAQHQTSQLDCELKITMNEHFLVTITNHGPGPATNIDVWWLRGPINEDPGTKALAYLSVEQTEIVVGYLGTEGFRTLFGAEWTTAGHHRKRTWAGFVIPPTGADPPAPS